MSRLPASPPPARDPDETVDIDTLIREVAPDPDVWRTSPNPLLGGKTPNDVIGRPEEALLRNMLRAAKHGMFS
jgi:hypothetical protein